MAYRFLGEDPIEAQVEEVFDKLAAGVPPSAIERRGVDVKEEAGRRRGRTILAGSTKNEEAAKHLAEEAGCFANTPGGGALIVGIADDGERIGTELEAEWLRHRIYELTGRKLTVDARPVDFDGTRVLVIMVPQAIEMITVAGIARWRVDNHCEPVDATSWAASLYYRSGYDWSAQQSSYQLSDASAVALDIARRYLGRDQATPPTDGLAGASDADLLRRLNLMDHDGYLTNAGALMFVTTPMPAIDYIRREIAGGDSTARFQRPGPLIEQLYEVERAADAHNRLIHLQGHGFAFGQVHSLPPAAVREAIVNGVTHRDWQVDQVTLVEHTGDVLVVNSPGGFVGGVNPSNIITHPSTPRYRSLAQAMADLRLAEREGIGVDRMVRDMLALGHRPIEIGETEGPYVRVTLVGGEPDLEWLRFLNEVRPVEASRDLDLLLLTHLLIRTGWVDSTLAAPALQRTGAETSAALSRLEQETLGTDPVVIPVAGVPAHAEPAWRLSAPARERLARRVRHLDTPAERKRVIENWALMRGRVSSTEVASLTGLSVVSAGAVLKELSAEGVLEGSSEIGRGRGFFYRPTAAPHE